MKIISNQEPIHSLSEKFGPEVADNLLRVLVDTSGENPTYFIKGELKDVYFSCDQAEKIRTEIACWTHACKQALERKDDDSPMLRRLSPALHDIYKSQHIQDANQVFARTYRMLLLLEALLLFDAENKLAPTDSNHYDQAINRLKNDSDIGDLIGLLGNLKTQSAELEPGSEWKVCLPLLLIVAIAESHCEYRQPFAWEAFSAGRSRDGLRRRWESIDSKFLNSCAVLIQYQSAVGQLGRGSGSGAFIKSIRQEENSLAFSANALLDALKLISIVEEARNLPIPKIAEISKPDPLFNAGSHMPWRKSVWDDDEFLAHTKKYIALDFDSTSVSSRNVTMSYFRHPYTGADDAEQMDNLEQILGGKLHKNLQCFGQVSLGRLQTQSPLREMLGDILKTITKETFDQYFDLKELEVPCVFFSTENPEHILQVFMKIHLVAEKLLIPNRNPLEFSVRDTCVHSAYDLFNHLLELSKTEMKLADDSVGSEQETIQGFPSDAFPRLDSDLYIPFPLVERITNIVHRLLPESCLNIPITIDYKDSVWIHIPSGIFKADNRSKRVLANLILATLLNRAMSSGLSHGEVDLQNLTILNPMGSTGITSSEVMTPDDWRDYVKLLYQEGGFDVLLGPYMRAYNTSGDTISFDTTLSANVGLNFADEEVNAVAVGSVEDDLKTYLPGLNISSKNVNNLSKDSPLWLLGIDIGATLTKCQFFKFTTIESCIVPQGEVFRMATEDSNTAKSLDSEPLQDRIRNRTKNFIGRLFKTISDRAINTVHEIGEAHFVVGLSWPGPIHDNCVAGTSRIVENFGLTRDICQNRVEDLRLIDLANMFQDSWNSMFQTSQTPFVTLLNDGDAEAVSALLKAIKIGSSLHDSHGLAVVKLGTGLAGGFISRTKDGKLSMISGLFEWGKINLDCAAHPRKGFPRGVAGEYLSKRTLPILAKIRGSEGKFYQQNDPDSLELSRIIDLSKAKNDEEIKLRYQELRIDCGAIQAEKNPLYGIKISAEVLRLVYNDIANKKIDKIDPDFLYQAQLALKKLEIAKCLQAELQEFGRIRIHRLLGSGFYSSPHVIDEAKLLSIDERFKEGANISEQCAQTLGRYLGDFCVLLHDQLCVEDLILTGGVLSNEGAGKIAKKEAENRVTQYGYSLKPIDGEVYRISKESLDASQEIPGEGALASSPPKAVSPKIESGAYGAACFSAASFLQAIQQKGFQDIRQMLLPQPTGTKVVFTNDILTVTPNRRDINRRDIKFSQYALSKKNITAFLRHHGSKWGYYESDDKTFVRWEPGE